MGPNGAPGADVQTPVTPPITPTPVTSRRRPVAGDDIAHARAGSAVTVRVLANDVDEDGDALRVVMTEQAANGGTRINADETITYTPRDGFVGSDSFSYTVSDDRDGSDTGSVTVSVQSAVSGSSLMERIASAPEGSWIKVNTNRFEDVWTPVAQRARVNDLPIGKPHKIITAWGAMTWDDNRRQLIIWGGGHADYAGNDVYRFDAGTLRWERASLPSAVVQPFGDARFFTSDGAANAPVSSHTYDNLEFLPLLDRMVTFGGAIYNTGQYFVQDDGVTRTGPYLWDPSRAAGDMVGGKSGSQVAPETFPNVVGGEMWMNRDSMETNGIATLRPGSFVNGTSAYVGEEAVESVLVTESPASGGDLFRYTMPAPDNPSLDRWELIGPGSRRYTDQGAGAYEICAFWEDAAVDHGTSVEGSPKYVAIRKTETLLAGKADALIGICQGIKNELVCRGIDEHSVFVIPNGVEVDRFVPRARNEALVERLGLSGKTVVAYIGTFANFEGVPLRVRALIDLIKRRRDDLRGLIVGEGTTYEECKKLAADARLSDRILQPVKVPHSEVEAMYSVVDILAYPRLSKRVTELATPLKPLEAMSMEKAVIGSSVGGLPELITDGQTGL